MDPLDVMTATTLKAGKSTLPMWNMVKRRMSLSRCDYVLIVHTSSITSNKNELPKRTKRGGGGVGALHKRIDPNPNDVDDIAVMKKKKRINSDQDLKSLRKKMNDPFGANP